MKRIVSSRPRSSSLDALWNKVWYHLAEIYPYADLNRWTDRVIEIFFPAMAGYRGEPTKENGKNGGSKPGSKWSQEDMLLITYGNSITKDGELPLHTLKRFLEGTLKEQISIVHILPFFPYSSDDGFAVMDYFNVNPGLGGWDDISAISEEFRLMSDLVINHTSSRAGWFENFKQGVDPGKEYYVTVAPDGDISKVIRPRTSPLLREVETPEGTRHVWCTFSHDQVDLDFKNPNVLLEFLRIIDLYMEKGVTIFRLDAVAFLWKELCTTCLHLNQTHEIIKLFRTLMEFRDPEAILITETNVPIHENLSYLGDGDEAHVIYNFPLPPLLLNTLVTGNADHFNEWLRTSPDPVPGTTFLNFIASHDGIGVRPVEGILSDDELSALIKCMEAFGGKISTRALNDHRHNPYEINISLWDAFKGTIQTGNGDASGAAVEPDEWQFERFICAHAVMLALKGIPAFYIHSLLGTKNDYVRMENTGSNRAINRHIWDSDELYRLLSEDVESHHLNVFSRLKELMGIRKKEIAFHPDADQILIESPPGMVAFLRKNKGAVIKAWGPPDVYRSKTSLGKTWRRKALKVNRQAIIETDQLIYCLYNITDHPISIRLEGLHQITHSKYVDLISGAVLDVRSDRKLCNIELAPYQFTWLTQQRK